MQTATIHLSDAAALHLSRLTHKLNALKTTKIQYTEEEVLNIYFTFRINNEIVNRATDMISISTLLEQMSSRECVRV